MHNGIFITGQDTDVTAELNTSGAALWHQARGIIQPQHVFQSLPFGREDERYSQTMHSEWLLEAAFPDHIDV